MLALASLLGVMVMGAAFVGPPVDDLDQTDDEHIDDTDANEEDGEASTLEELAGTSFGADLVAGPADAPVEDAPLPLIPGVLSNMEPWSEEAESPLLLGEEYAISDDAAGDAEDPGDVPYDRILGTEVADTLLGAETHDEIAGLGGDDALRGGGGQDTIDAGDGADTIGGDAGDDALLGDGGDDLIFGGAGDDALFGETGHDTLSGGAGADSLVGGSGNDVLAGGDDGDALQGMAGADTLSGGLGADTLFGGQGDDVIDGTVGADAGADVDEGDFLNGGAGDDIIFAGAGDTVSLGTGADSLFVGAWVADAAPLVEDFDVAEDKLLVVYENGAAGATPNLQLVEDSDTPGVTYLVVDGQPLVGIEDAGELTVADVVLVDATGQPLAG